MMVKTMKETMENVRGLFGRALAQAGDRHPDMVCVTPEMMYPTRAVDFAQAHPDRYIDVGIAEQNAMTVAAGLATCGKRVAVCGYADFVFLRSGEQLRLDVAYTNLNVKVFQLCSGVTFGIGGVSHQTFEDIAATRAIPNLRVIVPADARAGAACVAQVMAAGGPYFVRLGRDDEYVVYPSEDTPFAIGKANILREGEDCAFIACGCMVYEALCAAETLAARGIRARVIDMHTIKPIDREAVLAAARTRLIVTAEEHNVMGGLGSAVLEVLDGGHACPVRRIGFDDVFPVVGDTFMIRKHYGMHRDHLVETVLEHWRTLQ